MTDQERRALTIAYDEIRAVRRQLESHRLLIAEIRRALEMTDSFIPVDKRISWLLHQFDKGRLEEIVQQIEERRHHVKEHQP